MAETYRSVGPDVLEEIFTIVEEANQERKRWEDFVTLLSNYIPKMRLSLRIVQAGERAAATSEQGAGKEKNPHRTLSPY